MSDPAVSLLWSPGRLLQIARELRNDRPLRSVLRNPLAALDRGVNTRPGRSLAAKSRSVARLVLQDGRPVYLKYFYPKNPWRYLLALLLPPRASNAFRVHRHLRNCNLPVPQPLAALVRRRGLLPESFLLVAEIPNSLPVRNYILQNIEQLRGDSDFRSTLFTEVGRLTRRFHELRYFHVDLSVKNILRQEKPGQVPSFDLHMIDFDAAVSLRYLPNPLFTLFRFLDLRRLYNSVRYGLPSGTRETVLNAYFEADPHPQCWKQLFLRFVGLLPNNTRE